MSKKQQIVKLLATYLSAYPQSKLTEAGLLVYANALDPLEFDAIKMALTKLVRTSKFFPAVAEIYSEAEIMKAYTAGRRELPTAAEAWGEVMRLALRKGYMQDWEYSSEIIGDTVRQFGGKLAICELEQDAVNTARAQFLRMYESNLARHRDRSASRDAVKMLGGQSKTGHDKVLHLTEKLADSKAMEPKKLLAAE